MGIHFIVHHNSPLPFQLDVSFFPFCSNLSLHVAECYCLPSTSGYFSLADEIIPVDSLCIYINLNLCLGSVGIQNAIEIFYLSVFFPPRYV